MDIRHLSEEEFQAALNADDQVRQNDSIEAAKQQLLQNSQQNNNPSNIEAPLEGQKLPSNVKGLQDQFAVEQSPESQNAANLIKNIGALGIRAAQGLPNLAAAPETLRQYIFDNAEPDTALGKVVSSIGRPAQKLSEMIEDIGKENLGLDKQLNSNDFVSKVAQLSAGNLPLLVLSGGLGLSKGAADILGSAGMVGAEKMGFGPAGQILGSALGQVGFTGLANIARKSPTQRASLIENLYKREAETGNKIKVNPSDFMEPFSEVYKDTIGKNRKLYADKLTQHVDKSLNELPYAKTASELFNQKTDFNQIYDAIKDPSKLDRRLMNRINGVYNKTLRNIGENNPGWWKYADSANNLSSISKWQEGLLNTITSSRGLEKLAKSYLFPLGLLQGVSGYGAAAAKAGGVLTAGKGAIQGGRALYHMMRTPEGRKVYADLVAAGAKGAQGPTNKALQGLKKYVDKNSDKLDQPAISYLSEEEFQKALAG